MTLVVGQNSVWQNTYRLAGLSLGRVNRVSQVYSSAAGKGANVARTLRLFGQSALLLAYAGGPNGRKFVEACRADGISLETVEIERETRICTTLIEESGRITEIVEPAPEVSLAERERFRAAFDSAIGGARLLAISGTAVGGEPDGAFLDLVVEAHRRGVPVLLDSYRAHGRRALEAAPEVLKINEDELRELSALPCGSREERATAARGIIGRYGVRWVIVTRGREGAEGFDAGGGAASEAPSVALVNAIGSGDAFTAGVIAHLLAARSGTGPASADDNDGAHAADGAKAAQAAESSARELFPWGASMVEALRMGTAMGSANCMSLKPGNVEAADYRSLYERVRVSSVAVVGEPYLQ